MSPHFNQQHPTTHFQGSNPAITGGTYNDDEDDHDSANTLETDAIDEGGHEAVMDLCNVHTSFIVVFAVVVVCFNNLVFFQDLFE